jgi:hypothetical protein
MEKRVILKKLTDIKPRSQRTTKISKIAIIIAVFSIGGYFLICKQAFFLRSNLVQSVYEII